MICCKNSKSPKLYYSLCVYNYLRFIKGTTTHLYIEASPYCSQLGYYGFSQVIADSRLVLHDCQRLRACVNKAFDEVYSLKEREMDVIHSRIDRIRYIDSELRTMFGRHVPHVPADPEWHWQVTIRINYTVTYILILKKSLK